jgi:hypothetical protein
MWMVIGLTGVNGVRGLLLETVIELDHVLAQQFLLCATGCQLKVLIRIQKPSQILPKMWMGRWNGVIGSLRIVQKPERPL